jgi:formylglycine-generating enzyme required for sulfatase activity
LLKRVATVTVAAILVATAALLSSHRSAATPTIDLGEKARCSAYSGLPPGWGQDPHAGMTSIRSGDFVYGSDRGYAEEKSITQRHIEAFWIDRTEVTNAQFASFVAATGYVTDAERHGGAAVFVIPSLDQPPTGAGGWWHLIHDANWRHPDGPGSAIDGRYHQPVVDVSYADALAYAHWLGRQLPDEAEWEYAAKAGLGNEAADTAVRDSLGHWQANVWQGFFPFKDSGEDGFAGRAPVGCYAANGWGLHDMVGNVWEWTNDRWNDHHIAAKTSEMTTQAGATTDRRVIKGGSFLCSTNYCSRARASSRQGQEASLPSSHIGFRTIARG